MNLKYFLLIVTILIVSCKDSSEIIIKNADGNVIEKYFMNQKDSLKRGLYQAFYDDGSVLEESNYLNGVLEGERKLYYPNGTLEISEAYRAGIMTGDYKTYFENGQLMLKMKFVNGSLEGQSLKYFSDGTLAEQVNFEGGEENGPFEEFHENGEIHWSGTFLDGDNEFGELKEYDLDGNFVKMMMCDSLAVCRTVWTLEDGDIVPKY